MGSSGINESYSTRSSDTNKATPRSSKGDTMTPRFSETRSSENRMSINMDLLRSSTDESNPHIAVLRAKLARGASTTLSNNGSQEKGHDRRPPISDINAIFQAAL